jgi:hypothetical protein
LATADFIKTNLNSQFNIGALLTSVVEKDKTFENLLSSSGGIDLSFEDTRRKVKIAEQIWRQNGQSFNSLIDRLNQHLG